MTKDNNFLAYLYLFLTVTFWAGNFVVGKLASFYEVPPFSLNFYRWLFAWLILAPFTIPEILEKRNYIIKNYKLFIVLGVTSITVFNSIVYYSLNFTQVISGVLMISTIPVMGPSKNHKNIYYCFGHHHLGWTLGPISGKIVSGMIANENTNLDLKPYSSLRFS